MDKAVQMISEQNGTAVFLPPRAVWILSGYCQDIIRILYVIVHGDENAFPCLNLAAAFAFIIFT
jgi:hypothetical protein